MVGIRPQKKIRGPRIRKNTQIRAKAVRTIDKDGNQVGIIEISKAISLARESKLDLVEVSPNADPPVCRIMDFGKYQYLQVKKSRQNKRRQSVTKLKEIKVRPRIEKHDYDVKLRHAREFLQKGNKLRIRLIFRGRELAHKELGFDLLKRIESDLVGLGNVEMAPRSFGRNVLMIFGPVRQAKTHSDNTVKKDSEDAKDENKPGSGETV